MIMLALFFYLLLETQAVIAISRLRPVISSQVTQCSPVTVDLKKGNFTDGQGSNPTPSSITILPFGAPAYTVAIPNIGDNTNSIDLSFVPLAAGQSFIASLSDSTGAEIGLTTDIIKVMPSATDDTSCIPASPKPLVFKLPDTVSQCDTFNITFDPTVVTAPPLVRIVNPKGPSYVLREAERVGTNQTPGSLFYAMNGVRGQQLVLAIDDGQGHSESSQLFSVLGDSSSSKSCLDFGNFTLSDHTNTRAAAPSTGLSTRSLVGIGVGSAVAVVVIASIMIVYVVRQRRQRRSQSRLYQSFFIEQPPRAEFVQGNRPVSISKPRMPTPQFEDTAGFVRNPAYASASYDDDIKISSARRDTMDSWAQPTPVDQIYAVGKRSTDNADNVNSSDVDLEKGSRVMPMPEHRRRPTAGSMSYSVASLDIERILDTAAAYTEQQSNEGGNPARESTEIGHRRPSLTTQAKIDTPIQRTHLTFVEEPDLARMPELAPLPMPGPPPTVVLPPAPALSPDQILPRGRHHYHQYHGRNPDVPADPSLSISSTMDMFGSRQPHVSVDSQSRGYRISNISDLSPGASNNAQASNGYLQANLATRPPLPR